MEDTVNIVVDGFQYNSIVILSYFFICFAIKVLDSFTHNYFSLRIFSTSMHSSLLNPITYFRFFSHCLGHRDWRHLSNNFIKILLIGPMLEEKYGSFSLLMMIIITSGTIGVLNRLFGKRGIYGASGVLFMMIVLSSFVNVQGGKIPFTLVLILIFFVVDEIIDVISRGDDGVSHTGHIYGALCGVVFGILYARGFNFDMLLNFM